MAGELVTPEEVKPCPYCGELILAAARKCRYCQEYLDPELRAAQEVPGDVDRLLMPVGRPASAIAAGYLGLFSLLPFVGLFAILFGLIALRTLKKNPHLLGRARAWFGLVMGIVSTLFFAYSFALMLDGWLKVGRPPF